jgi:hypothetical protein
MHKNQVKQMNEKEQQDDRKIPVDRRLSIRLNDTNDRCCRGISATATHTIQPIEHMFFTPKITRHTEYYRTIKKYNVMR